jgi:hypothetical protein
MRLLFIILVMIVGGIYYFTEYKADEIARSIIESKATEFAKRPIKIKSLKIDFLKERLTFKDIVIQNNDGYEGNLVEIKDLVFITDLATLSQPVVRVKVLSLKGIKFQYKVEIKDGTLVDKIKFLVKAFESSEQGLGGLGQGSSTQKPIDKDFLIKKLLINDLSAQVISNDGQINEIAKMNNMEFQNVGTTEDANQFKDVAKMIGINIVKTVTEEVLVYTTFKTLEDKLKNTIKGKILRGLGGNQPAGNKTILDGLLGGDKKPKIDKSLLDGLLKGDKGDILKKLDKHLKER